MDRAQSDLPQDTKPYTLYKNPITATPLPIANLSSQPSKSNEYNRYKLRYINSFTITNLTLLTII